MLEQSPVSHASRLQLIECALMRSKMRWLCSGPTDVAAQESALATGR